MRFRDESLTFRIAEAADETLIDRTRAFSYPRIEKNLGNFRLRVEAGEFTDSEILVLFGEKYVDAASARTRCMIANVTPSQWYRKDDILPSPRWRPEAGQQVFHS